MEQVKKFYPKTGANIIKIIQERTGLDVGQVLSLSIQLLDAVSAHQSVGDKVIVHKKSGVKIHIDVGAYPDRPESD